MTSIRAAALEAHKAGLCVVPPRSDGSKAPEGFWKSFQTERPSAGQIESWYAYDSGRSGLGLVCGAVSGGLEMLELEGHAVADGLADQLDGGANSSGLGDLLSRIILGYCETTPSGGLHLLYRCTEIDGNLKLARRPATEEELVERPDDKIKTLVETRGEGGYTIVAPSNGKTHPSGGAWELTDGGFASIVTITPDERRALLDLCRSFDQMPEHTAVAPPSPERPPRTARRDNVDIFLSTSPASGASWIDEVIDNFNTRTSWAEVLEPYGWTRDGEMHRNGHRQELWKRPGKTEQGHSATTNANGTDRLIVFSSSTPFETEPTSYDRFAAHVLLTAGANDRTSRTDVARRLRGEGFGPPPKRPASLVDPATDAPEPLAVGTSTLPEEFWSSSSLFEHIRQAAHSRSRSADVVLHAALARVAACLPHTIELPPIVGAAGSLNVFTAPVGPSGTGKSTGVAIARELLVPPPGLDIADNLPLGSGEGIAEAYMGMRKEPNEEGKLANVRVQVRFNAFIYVDEGEALVELMKRNGSTILETLRRAWTGATLGQANASSDRRRIVQQGMYRLGLVIGFQPEKAAGLLGDAAGGTPQRFLFCSAIDPSIPDRQPEWPGPLNWCPPDAALLDQHVVHVNGYVRHHLTVDEGIVEEIRATDLARQRGEAYCEELDGHAMLHRFKLAGLLAALHGGMHVGAEEWAWAEQIWRASVGVRNGIAQIVKRQSDQEEAAYVDKRANREFVAEAARRSAPAAVDNLAVRIAEYVRTHATQDDGVKRRTLQRQVPSSRDSAIFQPALTRGIELGWITFRDGLYFPGDSRPA